MIPTGAWHQLRPFYYLLRPRLSWYSGAYWRAYFSAHGDRHINPYAQGLFLFLICTGMRAGAFAPFSAYFRTKQEQKRDYNENKKETITRTLGLDSTIGVNFSVDLFGFVTGKIPQKQCFNPVL
jgi:hypothetical protein